MLKKQSKDKKISCDELITDNTLSVSLTYFGQDRSNSLTIMIAWK